MWRPRFGREKARFMLSLGLLHLLVIPCKKKATKACSLALRRLKTLTRFHLAARNSKHTHTMAFSMQMSRKATVSCQAAKVRVFFCTHPFTSVSLPHASCARAAPVTLRVCLSLKLPGRAGTPSDRAIGQITPSALLCRVSVHPCSSLLTASLPSPPQHAHAHTQHDKQTVGQEGRAQG